MGLLRNVSLFMEILNVVSLVSMLVVVLLFVGWGWWQCGDNDVIFPLSKWGEWGGDGRGREVPEWRLVVVRRNVVRYVVVVVGVILKGGMVCLKRLASQQ